MPASVVREGDALVFRGAIDRAAAPALWKQAQPLLAGSRRLVLGEAGAIDSAGLALLAELAGRVPGIAVEGEPPGLSELRAAYRLGPDLGFGNGG
ncbi:STAS domain-containing protein [Lysobacter sp. F6437]|uniref:STAS domain-containing protein n=1 Tax=Lysobacter sp. F6437 TaxID=3459296 RepID=UPI00403D5A9D